MDVYATHKVLVYAGGNGGINAIEKMKLHHYYFQGYWFRNKHRKNYIFGSTT